MLNCRVEMGEKEDKRLNETKEKSLSKIKIDLINEKQACEICSYNFKSILQIHHIVPKSLGGSDELNNLIILCPNCHKIIHAIDSSYSDDNFGVDYVDDWMDFNIHERKQIYLDLAVQILKARFPDGSFNQ